MLGIASSTNTSQRCREGKARWQTALWQTAQERAHVNALGLAEERWKTERKKREKEEREEERAEQHGG